MLIILAANTAYAKVLHLPCDYPVIQDAIIDALDGDTVLVADVTYTGAGNKNLTVLGKQITVTSEWT